MLRLHHLLLLDHVLDAGVLDVEIGSADLLVGPWRSCRARCRTARSWSASPPRPAWSSAISASKFCKCRHIRSLPASRACGAEYMWGQIAIERRHAGAERRFWRSGSRPAAAAVANSHAACRRRITRRRWTPSSSRLKPHENGVWLTQSGAERQSTALFWPRMTMGERFMSHLKTFAAGLGLAALLSTGALRGRCRKLQGGQVRRCRLDRHPGHHRHRLSILLRRWAMSRKCRCCRCRSPTPR